MLVFKRDTNNQHTMGKTFPRGSEPKGLHPWQVERLEEEGHLVEKLVEKKAAAQKKASKGSGE